MNTNISRWIRLAAAALTLAACSKPSEDITSKPPNAAGEVAIRVDDKGFTPSAVTAPKGKPLTLVFTRTTDETCAKEVVFPELNIEKPLPKDTPVRIELPSAEAHTYTFQCGIGMYKSKVVVQ